MDEKLKFDDFPNYRRLRVSLVHGEDRLYRNLLVDKRLNAEELGIVLSAVFGGEDPEDLFFISDGQCILPDYWIENDGKVHPDEIRDFMKDGVESFTPLDMVTEWEDLGSSFRFIYDSDDPWIFQCTAGEEEFLDREEMAIIEDGAGAGILEGGGRYMSNLLQGIPQKQEAAGDDPTQEEPFNPNQLAGFDAPLDLEAQQGYFNTSVLDLFRYYYGENYPDLEEGEIFSYDLAHFGDGFDMGPVLIDSMLHAVARLQIESSDFVKAAYKRLLKKYDEEVAVGVIVQELKNQLRNLITLEDDFGMEEYKRAIRSLR